MIAPHKREHALVGRLRVERVGGVGVRGAIGQAEPARELAADDGGLHILGRAEGGSARPHVDVGGEAAVDEGRARADGLSQRQSRQRLGVLLGERAGERHRGHRAGEGERRHHDDLIAPRHLHDPFEHRRVEAERRGRIDDGEQRRLALERRIVEAAGDLDHLDRVEIALPPEAVAVDRLVRKGQHVEEGVEMAHGRMDVDRLDRIAAPEVDRVERLPEADEVAVVGDRPGPPAAGAIEGVGRARHRAEGDVTTADRKAARGIARMQGEGPRREADPGLDQRRVEAHPLRSRIDVGAGASQDRPRLFVQDIDADLLEHRQGGLMNRFELVFRDEVERREGRFGLDGRSGDGGTRRRARRRGAGGGPESCGWSSADMAASRKWRWRRQLRSRAYSMMYRGRISPKALIRPLTRPPSPGGGRGRPSPTGRGKPRSGRVRVSRRELIPS